MTADPKFEVRTIATYVPVSNEMAMEYGLIPDTRPPRRLHPPPAPPLGYAGARPRFAPASRLVDRRPRPRTRLLGVTP